MMLLKAKQKTPKKQIFQISDLTFIKSMKPLEALLDGEELRDPIEVIKHEINSTQRMGAGGVPYVEKKYSVHKGSQRIQAALKMGYTHIEGVIIND